MYIIKDKQNKILASAGWDKGFADWEANNLNGFAVWDENGLEWEVFCTQERYKLACLEASKGLAI